MLVRIVKMRFENKHIDSFLMNFETQKNLIRNFQGCNLLELYRDTHDNNVFFTYSYWDSENDLNNYRNSALFKTIWAETKPMFSEKAIAWSVNKIVSLQ